MEIISPQKIVKILTWSFFLIFLLSTFLFASEKKTLPSPPSDTQKECDQNEPKSASPDSSLSSSVAPANEKKGYAGAFNPALSNKSGKHRIRGLKLSSTFRVKDKVLNLFIEHTVLDHP